MVLFQVKWMSFVVFPWQRELLVGRYCRYVGSRGRCPLAEGSVGGVKTNKMVLLIVQYCPVAVQDRYEILPG